MRLPGFALATGAALSVTAPASGAVVSNSYTFVTGDAGSGTYSLDIDFAANSIVLTAFNYTLGSTTFTTANVTLQQTGGADFIIGGNTNGAAIVSSLGGADDFVFNGGTGPVFPASSFTYYVAGGIYPERTTGNTIAFAQTSTSPVPEPETWAMMLLGFGAIGFSMRRRRRGPLAQPA